MITVTVDMVKVTTVKKTMNATTGIINLQGREVHSYIPCVSLDTDLKRYSNLCVLAYDGESVAQRVIDLPWDTPLATRDLSLQEPLDTEKAFTESRTFLTLRAETCDQHLIKDINST